MTSSLYCIFYVTLLFGILSPELKASEEPEMILIPAGSFAMGSNNRATDEKPFHSVYLDAFLIGKYEVTNAEYYKFWLANGKNYTPASYSEEYNIGSWPRRALNLPDFPVVGENGFACEGDCEPHLVYGFRRRGELHRYPHT